MMYQHPSRSSIYRVSSSFTRPANTTQYAAGDLVANSTTAASVTPLSWTVSRTVGGLVRVHRALLKKSQASITASDFYLHLFSASPTVSTTGDNGVFASVVSGYASHLGSIFIACDDLFADGSSGRGAPDVDEQIGGAHGMIVRPASGRIIYGLLATDGTYTPASAEVFTVELELERY